MLALRWHCAHLQERGHQRNHPMSTHRAISLVMHEQDTQISLGRRRLGQHTSIHVYTICIFLLGGIIYCPCIVPPASFTISQSRLYGTGEKHGAKLEPVFPSQRSNSYYHYRCTRSR